MVRADGRGHWRGWLRRWEDQQGRFNPQRERRFAAMLDVAEAVLPTRFRALDLGSGPGPLSRRLLERFPRARCVAVDHDPVVLRVGEGALGSVGGRLTWVDAKLGASGWTRALPPGRFDAAFSTTALHWLKPRALGLLYRDLGRILRRGGVFLNGDRLPWGNRSFSRLAGAVREVRRPDAGPKAAWNAWRQWWEAAERDPVLGPMFPERERRRSAHPTGEGDVSLEVHERALRRAGFREVAVVWRDLDDVILFARR